MGGSRRKRKKQRKKQNNTSSSETLHHTPAAGASLASEPAPAPAAQRPSKRTSWLGRALLLFVIILVALPVAHIAGELAISRDDPEVVLQRVADDVSAFLLTSVPEVKAVNLSSEAVLQHIRDTFPQSWRLKLTHEEILTGLYNTLPESVALNFSSLYPMQNRQELVDALRSVIPLAVSSNASTSSGSSPFSSLDSDFFDERPGTVARHLGIEAKHPVVIVPGFTTTGLELWKGRACAQRFFRQRLWGTTYMFQSFINNRECWLEHISLDPDTGSDPPDIKIRPSQGLEAVDYFVPGFVLWGKIIHSLADIGYDSNLLKSAAYDWRLSPDVLEARDGYFTQLKSTIESLKNIHGEKVAIFSHSYGDRAFRHFMGWVESEQGAAHPEWVEHHVAHYVQIAGPTLGAPKSITGLLNGESRDTAHMGHMQYNMAEQLFFSARRRVHVMRSWGSMFAMMPLGGETVWGNNTFAPDDSEAFSAQRENRSRSLSYGNMISYEREHYDDDMTHLSVQASLTLLKEHIARKVGNGTSVREIEDLLRYSGNGSRREQSESLLSDEQRQLIRRQREPLPGNATPFYVRFGKTVKTNGSENASEPPDWGDPLDNPLPAAPSMSLFCFYGVGKDTERSYLMSQNNDPDIDDTERLRITMSATQAEENLRNGVYLTDGDGSIPLLSLGSMCVNGWQQRRFNPSGMRVVTREFEHDALPIRRAVQGGPRAADHVDILNNWHMAYDMLMVVSGNADNVTERVHSDVKRIASRVPALQR